MAAPLVRSRRRVKPSVSRRDLGPELGITLSTVALTTFVYLVIVLRLDARPPLVLYAVTAAGVTFWRGLGPGMLASTLGTFVGSALSSAQFAHISGITERVPVGGFLLFAGSMFSSWLIYRARADQEDREDVQHRRNDALAFVSHELRQPLTSIQLAAALLEFDGSEQARSQATKQIVQSTARLRRVVDDLVDVATFRATAIAVQPTVIRLQDTILTAAEAARPFIEHRHQSLHVDVPQVRPLWISGDDVRLQQVLANLLSNASKYSPEGGQISISSREEDGLAMVTVRDTGVGIRRDMLESIFEPFVRESPGGPEGLGVGLTLARDLVTQHGGRISAHSDGPGCRSSFVVELPLHRRPTWPGSGAALAG